MAAVPSKMSVDNAFTSGDTPDFIISHTFSGYVTLPGPFVKKLMITSSMDRVNANIAPLMIPGSSIGSVMWKNTRVRFAPKSNAASSTDLSYPARRARTVEHARNGIENVVAR